MFQNDFRANQLRCLGYDSMPLLDDFLERSFWPAKQGLAGSTIKGYRRDVKLRIGPAFGSVPLDEISPPAIQSMIYSCPTNSSARNARGTLSSILGYAMDCRILYYNPACVRYIYPDKIRPATRYRAACWDEIAAWLRFARRTVPNSDIERTLLLGLVQGLRVGEIFGIDGQHIDMENNVLYIRQSYTRGLDGWELRSPKTAQSDRNLPILDYARERIGELGVSSGPWITGMYGDRANPGTVREHFLKWRRKYSLPDLKIATMRHSFAISALDTLSLADLSGWLGHTTTATTAKYCESDLDRLAPQAAFLSRELSASMGRNTMPGCSLGGFDALERNSPQWRLIAELEMEEEPELAFLTPLEEELLRMVKADPRRTIGEISKHLGVSPASIKRAIRPMRQSGVLLREGSARSGSWHVAGL